MARLKTKTHKQTKPSYLTAKFLQYSASEYQSLPKFQLLSLRTKVLLNDPAQQFVKFAHSCGFGKEFATGLVYYCLKSKELSKHESSSYVS